MALIAVLVMVLCLMNSRCFALTSEYRRAPKACPLPLDHPSLKAGISTVEQVHISLIDSKHVAINWVTARVAEPKRNQTILRHQILAMQQQGCTSQQIRSSVQYSLNDSFATDFLEVAGSFTCYSTGDYDSGLLHRAIIGPLEPSATYYYRCSDASSDWSKTYALKAPPADATLRIGIVGDLGQTQYTTSTLDHLQRSAPDLIVNVGDLSYADGEQPRWDSFGRLMESLVSEVPTLVTEGNHEMEDFTTLHTSSNLNGVDPEFVAYETRYTVPSTSPQNPSTSPLFYSVDVASIHIVMLGTYADTVRGSEQYAWLQSDLESVNRSVTPWVVVGMHAPWYNSNTAHQHEADDMQDAMEPLLFKYGVDLVMSGHVHAYERTSRVYANKPNDCGPYYIVIGDGGNREGLAGDWLDQPDWSLYRESSYGHGMLLVENTTHSQWQWYRNDADVKQLSDSFWLVRNPNCPARRTQTWILEQTTGKGSQAISQTGMQPPSLSLVQWVWSHTPLKSFSSRKLLFWQ